MNSESTGAAANSTEPIFTFAQGGNGRGQRPLVLGFAYSLGPDGGPGLYNRILAQTIIKDWAGTDAWIGVQWEIKDAMHDPQLTTALSTELQSKLPATDPLLRRLGTPGTQSITQPVHITPPFDPILAKTNTGGDALDWKAFRQLLMDSLGAKGDPAVAELAKALVPLAKRTVFAGSDAAALQKAISSPEQLAIYLNQLIKTKKDFYTRFWRNNGAMLELHGRQREDFGPVGFERRELPASGTSLGDYQAQRVNRLILDAVCPKRTILPQPGYLSTRGVLQYLFAQMQNPRDFDRIFIYGSPVHSGRCERQFVEFAWSKEWFVDLDQVTKIYYADDMAPCGWIWDERTAQVWCRSKAAWEAYEENDARLW